MERSEAVSLTYGEIDLESFALLLEDCQVSKRCSFLDLGCGLGRALLCVATLYPHMKVRGLEIMAPLVQIGREAIREWRSIAPKFAATAMNMRSRVELLHGDFLEEQFSWMMASHEVIWLSATCFCPSLMQKIADQISCHAKVGTQLLILSLPLPEKLTISHLGIEKKVASQSIWRLTGRKNYSMSWTTYQGEAAGASAQSSTKSATKSTNGGVVVHIYEKIDT